MNTPRSQNGEKSLETPSPNSQLVREIEDLLVSSVWTHQIQEKQVIVTQTLDSSLKILQIVISAMTGCTALVDLISSSANGKVIIAVLATLLVIVSSYIKSNSLSHKADLHRFFSARLWKIRQDITSILVDFAEARAKVAELQKARGIFVSELHDVSQKAPKASWIAVRLAAKALKIDGVSRVSDEERKLLLPSSLGKV
jgi:hypothetical protein